MKLKTLLIAAGLSLGVAGSASAQSDALSFVTSNTGGSFFPIGTAMSQVLSDNGIAAVAQPGGGNSNPVSVSQGDADLGFTFAPTMAMAMAGEAPFPAPLENIRALGAFYMNTTQIAVTVDSGVTSVAELAGQPFASQGLSAASATFFRMALEGHGISEDDLNIVVRGGPTQGANATRDRNAIGFQATTSIPNGTFSEAFQTMDLQLLPITDAAFEQVIARNPAFVRAVIPAGSYPGVDEDVPSMATAAVIVVNEAMDEQLAHDIVRVLAENHERLQGMHAGLRALTPELMASLAGVPLHPGAERYYVEQGLR